MYYLDIMANVSPSVKGALAYRKQPLQKWALLFCY